MSIFMTADQKPFFAGTYFPPESHYGRAGFRELLLAIADQWENERDGLLHSAEQIFAHINIRNDGINKPINRNLPKQAADFFSRNFDEIYGGFGQAPKFPTPHNLIFLMLYSYINKEKVSFEQAKLTLDRMRRGGIFDHIGHGFSRYSTDRYYLVPHFEKMLYDNALLIMAYAAAYKISGDRSFLDTAVKTAEYVLREMTGKDGEFYSAQDADSEGTEGKYYVWSFEEICKVLGEEKGRCYCEYFGITEQGNFEGKNIPNLLNGNEISEEFEKERNLLYEYRKKRTRLHLDDKILTSWNSLMISALAILYRVTGNREYLLAAEKAYGFIEKMLMEGKVLYVSCRRKKRSVRGFLDEYAYFADASICLYEVTSKSHYLKQAEESCEEAEKQFADKETGKGYFLCGTLNDGLITRPKETYDGALPSGNSVMAYSLVRLSQLEDSEKKNEQDAQEIMQGKGEKFKEKAEKQLAFLSAEAASYPAGHTMFLIAQLFYFYPPEKITAVLSEKDCAEEILASLPLYGDIKILPGVSEGYELLNSRTTYYVCKDNTCFPPVNEWKRF